LDYKYIKLKLSMSNKLYVGNLAFQTTENELQDLFSTSGPVNEVKVIMDRMSGRSRGFAFVTMATNDGARQAIQDLHGKSLQDRELTVNEARPMNQGTTGSSNRSFNRY
jgi:cold-inducible RNA-binding protein